MSPKRPLRTQLSRKQDPEPTERPGPPCDFIPSYLSPQRCPQIHLTPGDTVLGGWLDSYTARLFWFLQIGFCKAKGRLSPETTICSAGANRKSQTQGLSSQGCKPLAPGRHCCLISSSGPAEVSASEKSEISQPL